MANYFDRFDAPQQTGQPNFFDQFDEIAAPQEKSGFFRQVADVPVGVARGAVSGIRFIADAFGADNPASQALKGSEEYLAGLMSAQAKNDQQEVSRIWQEAQDKGLGDQILAGVKAFTVAPVDLLSQAFGTIGVNVVGGLAANLGKFAVTGTRMGLAGQRVAQGVTGATMGAGIAKGEIYEAVNNELLAAGASPEQAEAAAVEAQRYGGKNMDQILLSTGLGAAAATLGAESVIGKLIAGKGVAPTVGRVAGVAGTEFLTEAAQGTQEQLAKNIALQREGFDVPTTRGLGVAGTLEGLAGAGVGAGTAALSRAPVSGAPVPPENLPADLQPTDELVAEPTAEPTEEPAPPVAPTEQAVPTPPTADTFAEPEMEAPPEFAPGEPYPQSELPPPAELTQAEQEYDRLSKEYEQLEKSKPPVNLWSTLKGKLDPREIADLGSEKGYRFLSRKEGGVFIDSLVSRGLLDDFIPNNLKVFGDEDAVTAGDRQMAAVEYIKDKLRNKNYLTAETEDQLRSMGYTLQTIEREIQQEKDYEQQRVEINDLLSEIRESLSQEEPPADLVATPPQVPTGDLGEPARAPRTVASISEVETGRPFSYRGFRGQGKTADEIYSGAQVPVAGPARYVALNPEDARQYGDQITEEPVTLNNPLVIRNDDEWRALTRDSGWEFPNPFMQDESVVRKNTEALKRLIQDRGYDGLVIDPSSYGDSAKTLNNVFGGAQIVDYTQAAEPQPLQLSPEEQAKQDLANFEAALSVQTMAFTAVMPNGRRSVVRPRPLSRPQIKLLTELAKDAVELGMPSSILTTIKSGGLTSVGSSALIAPKTGALMLGAQWGASTKAEKLATFVHELGHVVDFDASTGSMGFLSQLPAWQSAHDELKNWYDSNPTPKHPLSYPFSSYFDKRLGDKRLESFPQALSYYFTMPVELQANAPTAYSEIQSIVERIQNESRPAKAAGAPAPTTAPIEVREEGIGEGPAVQPPAGEVGTGVSRDERGRDQAAVVAPSISPEGRRRAKTDPRLRGTKIVDADGNPLPMYHGTTKPFEEIKAKKGLVFVTPDPNFANKFAMDDLFWTPGKDIAPPENARVLPVYVRATNPFDYENKSHINRVARLLDPRDKKRFREGAAEGRWQDIEDFIEFIEESGFDAAYLQEQGRKNLALFNANQVIPSFETQPELEDKRRADMERDLFRLTPEGQVAPAEGVQGDMFGATGDLAKPRPAGPRAADKGQLPLLGDEEVNVYPMRNNIFGQPVEASWGRHDETKADTWLYRLQDKMLDTKRVQQQIVKAGREIADRWNAYLKEELFHGRSAKKTKDFLLDELEPLMKEMSKRDISMADLEEYLHNRAAEERNNLVASRDPERYPDGGSGILTADANKYLDGLPPKRRADFEATAKMIDSITKKTRQLLVDSGHESAETIAAWEKALPNYVPLNRAEAEYELKNMGNGVGQGFAVRGAFSKSVVGSERPVVDILANIAMQRERAIVRTEKMRVGQALYGLVLQNPNPGFWLAVDPEAEADPENLKAIVKNLLDMGFGQTSDEVVSIKDLINSIMQQPTLRKVDASTNEVVSRVNQALVNSPYTIPVRINGVEKYIFFNPQDPIAKRMAESLRNVDADQMDKVLGPIAKVTRYFAAVNTQYNPIFGVINFMRDFQAAALQLSTTPLAGKQKEVAEKTLPALRGIYADLRARRKGERATSEYALLWEKFQDVGGQTGFRDQFSRSDERADALYSVLNPEAWTETTLGKIFTANGTLKVPLETARKSVAKPLFDWLTDYNETMENAVRLAAFKTALDSGISEEQAASIAKNLTVNFNRKGLIGKQAGALYAFFNASVQGTARMARTLIKRENGKIVFTPTGKKIFYGGLLLGSAQAMLMAAAGFDEDEPPEFVKERNLIVPVGGGKYVSVPYPLGFNVIPNTGRVLTEWAMSGFKDTSKRVASLTGSLLEMFNPIGSAGWSWQSFSPTFADPAVALFENRDWTGKPIAKEDFSSLDPTPGYTRARDTASWFSKNLSEFLNLASGGTKFQKGLVSPTPDQIDYLIGQITGGVGREVLKAEQTARSVVTGEELPMYKIPLAGRFVGDTTGQAAVGNKFYINLTELNGHQREIEGRRKAGQEVQSYLMENPEARLYKTADRIQRNVSKLRKRRSEMIEKDASKEQIKAIENQITLQMKRLNDEVARFKE